MMYFNPNKKRVLWVDASDYALDGILLQENNTGYLQPIMYILRALTKYETKYYLTEKEALGLVWGIDKLHIYLYHTNFEMIVDHMPLNFIFDTKNCPSPRVERWQMKLQRYSFNVI